MKRSTSIVKKIRNLYQALRYAKRGFYVFPCHYLTETDRCSCKKASCKRAGKHPRTRNGLKDATRDPEAIRRWWTDNPDANIAIATGHEYLMVLDVDTGEGKTGAKSLAQLEESIGKLPDTLRQTTRLGWYPLLFSVLASKSRTVPTEWAGTSILGAEGVTSVPPQLEMENSVPPLS